MLRVRTLFKSRFISSLDGNWRWLLVFPLALAWMVFGALPSAQAATIVVDGTNCTLAQAITAANTPTSCGTYAGSTGADTITFDANYTARILLGATLPAITSDITIVGRALEISGNDTYRIFHVQSGHLRLDRLTLINGEAGSNGSGGAILVNSGAALTVTNGYFAGNTADGNGGAIASSGSLTVSNSSLDGNGARGTGGGAFYISGGSATITHVTMYNNSASGAKGEELLVNGSGARVSLRNSMLGDNDSSSNDCGLINSATLRQNVGNVIEAGDSGCTTPTNRRTMGIHSTRGNPPAITISATSHANGAGDSAICKQYKIDQTGIRRPETACDAGAAERAGFNDIYVDSGCTLSQAIQNANDNAQTNSGCEGGVADDVATDTIHLTANITLSAQAQGIDSKMIIEGNGHTITATGSVGHLAIGSSGNLTMRDITLTGANKNSGGGAISVLGTLDLSNCVLRNNHTSTDTGGGGAISFASGSNATVNRCAFIDNSSDKDGGAISVEGGTVTVSNSTFESNHSAENGGAIAVSSGTATLVHLTVWDNTSSGSGFVTGIQAGGTTNLYNSIIGRSTTTGGALCGGSFQNSGTERGIITWNGPQNDNCGTVIVADPNLGAKTGSIPYLPLGAGSPAIGKGIDALCALYATDQIGNERPATACDIGAVQYVPPPAVPAKAEQAQAAKSSGPSGLYVCTGEWLNANTGIRISASYGLCNGAQFQRLDAGGVGIQWVVDGGFLDAVDVWGWVRPTVEVCFPQAGKTLFLDAAASPRTVSPLASFRDGNFTCARIGKAGTIVLMSPDSPHGDPPAENAPAPLVAPAEPAPAAEPAQPAPAATEIASIALTNCMVRTKDILNLRESPGGKVIGLAPWEAWLTAFRYALGWYYVDLHGERGWISADYVEPRGDFCG